MNMLKFASNNRNGYRLKSQAAIIAVAIIALLVPTATALTGFPGVAPIFATLANDTAGTNATTTTMTSPTPGQEQQIVNIIKDGTNSYFISGGSSSIGTFDTTYRIVGESNAVRASEDLIISTITSDYSSSPTIGYVMASNMTNSTTGGAASATLPNPFASPEQITERITTELRNAIGGAEGNASTTAGQQPPQLQQQQMEIKCDFGMALDDMRCHHVPLVGAIEDISVTMESNVIANPSEELVPTDEET